MDSNDGQLKWKGVLIGVVAGLVAAAALMVIGGFQLPGGAKTEPDATQRQETAATSAYKLAIHDGYVAIFPLGSSEPYQISNLAVSDLSPEAAAELGAGVQANSLEDAKQLLDSYRQEASAAGAETPAKESHADAFPRIWTGTFGALSADGSTIETNLQISLSTIQEDGSVSGLCMIGFDGTHWYDRTGSYNIEGLIDWDNRTIELWGTTWADQQVLEIMRRFEGKFDSSYQTIDGKCETTNGDQLSSWHMIAS